MVRAAKSLVFSGLLLCGLSVGALGETAPDDGLLQVESPEAAQILLPGQDQTLQTREAMPGTFMMPDAPGQDAKPEKCMTVCARWGEDCLLINKGAGGMQRKCRRTCKQFAEECF